MMQIFNFINCRVIDNQKNVFKNITKNPYFVGVVIIVFVLQIIFLTFCGYGIKTVMWGLDPVSWLLCIAFGALGLVWSYILKFIPLENVLPGGGDKELTKEELDRMSSINVRKKHDSNFYKHQSSLKNVGSGMIEDRNLN